jgi:hypothetical protein
VGLSGVAGAQGSAAPSGAVEDALQLTRQMIQTDRQTIVAANMDMTEPESQAFWPLYREYRGEMAKVGDRLQKLIQDYARVYDTATAEQAKPLVDEMMAIERAGLTVKETYLPKLRKVLPEVKVARFLQIENELDAVIRLGLAADMPLIGTTE